MTRPAAGLALTLAALACGRAEPVRPLDIPPTGPITIVAVGDVLIAHPLGPGASDPSFARVQEITRGATAALANLEVNLLGSEQRQLADARPAPRWPYGDERDARQLQQLGFDLIGLANDHATDYGPEGLRSTQRLLDGAGLLHAGTGAHLDAARAPVFAGATRRVALIAVASSSQPESRATRARADIAGRPGINPLRYSVDITVDARTFQTLRESAESLSAGTIGENHLMLFGTPIRKGERTIVAFVVNADDERAVLEQIAAARSVAEVVIVSIHSHEPANGSETPADFIQQFARAAIDAGAGLVVGHGPHRLRGVELYKQGVIAYSLGNFLYQAKGVDFGAGNMFDRGTDLYGAAAGTLTDMSRQRDDVEGSAWWQGAIAVASFDETGLTSVKVHPVDLGSELPLDERGLPRLASGARRNTILNRLDHLSGPYRTLITSDGLARPR